MDEAFKDDFEAKLKRREANRLRLEEMYHRDNPRVVRDLEDAAKQVDIEATGYQEQAADDAREERAARSRIPPEDTE